MTIEASITPEEARTERASLLLEIADVTILVNNGLYKQINNRLFPLLTAYDPSRLELFSTEAKLNRFSVVLRMERGGLISEEELKIEGENLGIDYKNASWFWPDDDERAILYSAEQLGVKNEVIRAMKINGILHLIDYVNKTKKESLGFSIGSPINRSDLDDVLRILTEIREGLISSGSEGKTKV